MAQFPSIKKRSAALPLRDGSLSPRAISEKTQDDLIRISNDPSIKWMKTALLRRAVVCWGFLCLAMLAFTGVMLFMVVVCCYTLLRPELGQTNGNETPISAPNAEGIQCDSDTKADFEV